MRFRWWWCRERSLAGPLAYISFRKRISDIVASICVADGSPAFHEGTTWQLGSFARTVNSAKLARSLAPASLQPRYLKLYSTVTSIAPWAKILELADSVAAVISYQRISTTEAARTARCA